MYDYDVILSLITAFSLTYFVIPPIIRVSHAKNLFDVPGERASHHVSTPRLGGVAIFAGVLFSVILWTPFKQYFGDLQYMLAAFILIFLIGVKDDIVGISLTKKLTVQILAAVIVMFKSNVMLTSLHGLVGITSIPVFVGAPLTVFTIIVIINAVNLIDGINGLSGTIATIVCLTLGIWFLLIKRYDLAILALSTAGSTIAFLKFNYTPAKIFMGDTGALLIGMICAILAIQFIELNSVLDDNIPYKISSAPAVAVGILILPLFDTLRVFVTRIIRGKHPLHADRNHIHHLLIDSGLTHMQATALLAMINLVFIVLVLMLQRYSNKGLLMILLMGTLASLMVWSIFFMQKRRERNGKKRVLSQTTK
jgi:UDP-N-acetylmuramyl pentapeptide phosphotransferase/UDP-N-acetylglucosamine-1-phosphate transferase